MLLKKANTLIKQKLSWTLNKLINEHIHNTLHFFAQLEIRYYHKTIIIMSTISMNVIHCTIPVYESAAEGSKMNNNASTAVGKWSASAAAWSKEWTELSWEQFKDRSGG